MGHGPGTKSLDFGNDPDLGLDSVSILSLFPTWRDMAFFDIEQYYSKCCGPIFTKLAGWVRPEPGTNPLDFGTANRLLNMER